jgi:hypothetical protein
MGLHVRTLAYPAFALALLMLSSLASHFAWLVESDAPSTRVTRAIVWLYDIASWTMWAALAIGLLAQVDVETGGDSPLTIRLQALAVPFLLAAPAAGSLRNAVRARWRNNAPRSVTGPHECPKCQLVNPPTARRCDCGHEFAAPTGVRGVAWHSPTNV